MKNRNLTPFSLISVLPIIFLSFFLNYLSSSYAEIDLFKLDLVQKENPKTTRKLIFILKNSHLLFTIVCFFQVILNALISTILIDHLKIELRWKTLSLIGIAFMTALFTELLARFLAVRKRNRKMALNGFFINLTYYLLLRPFSFLQVIIKPKKKLFSDSEQDLIRFFNNLMEERILEKEEAHLVQAALRFDETTINHLIIPAKKVIFLQETMSLEEVKKVYSQNLFTRYPVLDRQKKKIIGVLSLKRIFLISMKDKENHWQNQIDKRVPCLLPSTKLNKALEKSQTQRSRIMIVKVPKKGSTKLDNSLPILGIITIHDILKALVGKIQHEPEKSFPLLPAKPLQPAPANPGSEDNPTKP